MAAIIWDKTGERFYESGVDHGVLYVQTSGTYGTGVAWNGLTTVSEKSTGAESSPQWADNIKYLNLTSVEEFGATIEAFTYPPEFEACEGMATLEKGVTIGQQKRSSFGFSYRTLIGNDVEGTEKGYKIHLVYGAQAAPTERSRNTVNENTEAMTMSWEITTTPVEVKGFKPTAHLTISSVGADPEKLAAFEKILYGDDESEPRLPLPDEVKTLLTAGA